MVRTSLAVGNVLVMGSLCMAQPIGGVPCTSLDDVAGRQGEFGLSVERDDAAGADVLVLTDLQSEQGVVTFRERPTVEAGQSYGLSARIRADALSLCQVRAVARFVDPEGVEKGRIATPWAVRTCPWVEYRGTGEAPAGAVAVELSIEATLSSMTPVAEAHRAGRALLAAVSLRPVPRVRVETERVGNLFERGTPIAGQLRIDEIPQGLEAATLDAQLADLDGVASWGLGGHVLGNAEDIPFRVEAPDQGYYELAWRVTAAGEEVCSGRTSMAVVPKLADRPRDPDSPLALDAGFSWFYVQGGEQRLRDAARVAHLAGINCLRDRLSWSETNPAPAEFRWGAYADAAATQRDEGLAVYQIIHDCPAWASGAPPTAPSPHSAPPDDLRSVFDFFRRAASDFSDSVRYWEIWNEPDIFFFGGRGEEYAGILKAAYLGCRRGNPECEVLNGSLAMGAGRWYERAFESGLADYYDIFNMHYYGPTDGGVLRLDGNRAFLKRYNADEKPVWITEMGVPTHRAQDGTYAASEREQADYLVRSYAQAIGQGVDRFFFFYMAEFLEAGSSLWGIVRDDLTPKPAYAALANLTEVLEGVTPLGRVDLGAERSVGYLFRTARGPVLIAWNEDGAPLPTDLQFDTAADILGRPTTAPTFTGSPVVLSGVDPDALRIALAPPQPGLARVTNARLEELSVVLDLRLLPENDALPGEAARKEPPLVLPGQPVRARASLYNFGNIRAQAAEVTPTIALPEGWTVDRLPARVALEPGAAKHTVMQVTPGELKPGQEYALRLTATSPGHDVMPSVAFVRPDAGRIEPARSLRLGGKVAEVGWRSAHAAEVKLDIAEAPDAAGMGDAITCAATMPPAGNRWAVAQLPAAAEWNLPAYDGLELQFVPATVCPEDLIVILMEENGAQYMRVFKQAFATPGVRRLRGLFSEFTLNTGVSEDANGRLDLEDVRMVMVGGSFWSDLQEVRWRFSDVALIGF